MVLYIDETENDEYFIVAGLLVHSEIDVRNAYKRFKNRIKGFPLSNSTKSKLYTEFKSTMMDKEFQRIKRILLHGISDLNCTILFSAYHKNSIRIKQVIKESIYITLFSAIISNLQQETTVIFDAFNKPDFEERIVDSANDMQKVIAIYPADSQKEPGLQFVDNICSTIRLKKSNEDIYNYYKSIQEKVIEV